MPTQVYLPRHLPTVHNRIPQSKISSVYAGPVAARQAAGCSSHSPYGRTHDVAIGADKQQTPPIPQGCFTWH